MFEIKTKMQVANQRLGVGFKYDYNYDYYNGYYGPVKDGEGRHDFGAYLFNQSRGITNADKLFDPLSNPLTHKTKLGFWKKDETKFIGIEDGGSIRLILGVDYKFKIGFTY